MKKSQKIYVDEGGNVFIQSNDSHTLLKKLERYNISFPERRVKGNEVVLKFYSSTVFRKLEEMQRKTKETNLFDLCDGDRPTIHITEVDIFDEKESLHYIPRFKKFFDSSIWHYYFPIHRYDTFIGWNSNNAKAYFNVIIKEIFTNYKNGIYKFKVSKEYLEFNNRIFNNSYLKNNGHGQYISPFIFHSEREIKYKIKEKEKDLALCFSFRWRILLLDDYANKSMIPDIKYEIEDTVEKEKNSLCTEGKLQIIINNILLIQPKCRIAWSCPMDDDMKDDEILLSWQASNNIEIDNNDFDIAIICVRDVKSAKNMLKHFKFDIILLDYLLGEKANCIGREYSYELLCEIANDCVKQKPVWIGPLGKLFFMHISAFVPAISERLQEQGLIRDTKYWHIARGACPTNTPNLFLYYLYLLMEKRYSEMMFEEDDVYGHTLIDLLYFIFDSGFRYVKGNATSHFNTLLNLRRKYDLMKNDIFKDEFLKKDWLNRRGSLLVYSLFPDIQYYSNSFWEHMQQLIYLVAYGTSRQWPEMWEEYMFVRDRIKNAEEDVKVMFKQRPNFIGQMPSEQIEKYIIHLKNA